MATKRFDRRLNILVSEAERKMLAALADRDGLTPSDVVRQLIRQRHADVIGDPGAMIQPSPLDIARARRALKEIDGRKPRRRK